jgi:hypothetical protein
LSPKRDAFTLFQSETSIFHDEETSSISFPDAKKARMVLQQSPKSKPPSSKTKKTMTDKQENQLTGMQNLKIQKFKIFILTHTHTKKSVISGVPHRDNTPQRSCSMEFSKNYVRAGDFPCH